MKRWGILVLGIALVHAGLVLGGDLSRQPSVDSYCHASFAAEIARGGFTPDLAQGLPWTIFARLNVDHYWGHHLLTAPWVGLLGQLLGMKAAVAFFFALVPVTLFLVLQSRDARWAPALALVPLCMPTQDWRYLQLRGGAWMVVLLLSLVHTAFLADWSPSRRRLALWALGYVGMLSYHGGVVLLAFHGVGVVWLALRSKEEARARWADPFATAGGLVSGLLFNPYMDRNASTFRFAWYHITRMGTDLDRLYADWARSEFQPFPVYAALHEPRWLLMLVAVLVAASWGIFRRVRGRDVPVDEWLLSGLALLGIAWTARTLRVREYAVPVVVLYLGIAARPWLQRLPKYIAHVALLGVTVALLNQSSFSLESLSIERVHAGAFSGAKGLLERNGSAPILNIAESDYCLLRWEYPKVVAVQALSRYFLWPDRELYSEVKELHDRALSSPNTAALLQKFYRRGVRLVVTHSTHKLHIWAEAHPESLELAYQLPRGVGAIWFILPAQVTQP